MPNLYFLKPLYENVQRFALIAIRVELLEREKEREREKREREIEERESDKEREREKSVTKKGDKKVCTKVNRLISRDLQNTNLIIKVLVKLNFMISVLQRMNNLKSNK